MKASIYQKRFWLEWQANPDSAQYNECFLYKITGHINLPKLKDTFEKLSRKYCYLRSCFDELDGNLIIKSIDNFNLPYRITTLQGIKARDEKVLIQEIMNTPFNLKVGPLWGVNVLQTSQHNIFLMLSFHHIVIDGNCYDNLRKDIAFFYNQPAINLDEINSDQKKLKQQLAAEASYDFQSPEQQEALFYYRGLLSNRNLSCNFSPMTAESTSIRLSIDNQLRNKLRIFCASRNCTTTQFMLAMYACFIYQYFDGVAFSVLYPTNMRTKYASRSFSSCINLQFIPFSCDQYSCFDDLLEQVIMTREKTRYCKIPYENLFADLLASSHSEQLTTVKIIASETDLKLEPLGLRELIVEALPINKENLPYDLSLEYQFTESSIELKLDIKNRWFEHEKLGQQVRNDIQTLIRRICMDSKSTFRDMWQHLPLREKNTTKGYSEKNNLLRIDIKFDQVVSENPGSIALIDHDKKISYTELSRRISNMTQNLSETLRDVCFVGVSMKHSLNLVVTILALFRLGKTYIPINPKNPKRFTKEIIADAQLKYLIVDSRTLMEGDYCLSFLMVEDFLEESSQHLIPKCQKSSDLAYILYTSGTSGKPKGVMTRHSAIVELVNSCQRYYDISNKDRVVWFHSYAFDFSTWEIWSALLSGATLVVLSKMEIKSPRQLTRALCDHQVTILNQTPTAFKQWQRYLLSDQNKLKTCLALRFIIFGGEAFCANEVDFTIQQFSTSGCRFFNMYGITEDTVHSSIYEITINNKNDCHPIIGRAIPGKTIKIIGHAGKLQPRGSVGEIYLSGFGLAAGYFNNSVLSQAMFVEHDGIRWLKTGDYARMRENGDIEYIGRKDNLCKHRGYRISLIDIQGLLLGLTLFDDVVISMKDNLLLCFIVVSDARFTSQTLQKIIATILPTYMMPDRVIVVKSIPLTNNGKVNTKKLLSLISETNTRVSLEGQHDEITKSVLNIWRNLIFNIDFGLEDNFFDCGGNSVLLVRLQQQLEECFNVEISMIDLFSNPSVRKMADLVKRIK